MSKLPKEWLERTERLDEPHSDPAMQAAESRLRLCEQAGLSREEAIRRARDWLGERAATASALAWSEAFFQVALAFLAYQFTRP